MPNRTRRISKGSRAISQRDKTFSIYLANDMGAIEKHTELSGFPASKITEIATVVDPTLPSRAIRRWSARRT